MVTVSDTTPLSELSKVGRIEILEAVYGEIWIPQEVYDEVTVGTHPAAELVQSLSWLKVRAIERRQAFDHLREATRLGKGECAAMILAEEMNATQLLMDDLMGRRIALSRGLPVVGTIGTLLLAKRQGVIQDVKDILDALIVSGKWIGPRLYQDAIAIANETT